jgi:F-box-like
MLPASPFTGSAPKNYVASSDEKLVIQRLIKQVEPQIACLDAEIEALKQKRALCTSFVTFHSAFLSPISQMPPDILQTIFSHCLPHDTPDIIMRPSEAPLLLTQICSQWRDFAIRAPTLWSSIFLKVPIPPRGLQSGWPSMLPRQMINDVDVDIETAKTSEALFTSLADAWRRKMESLISLTTLWLARAEGCSLTIFFRDLDRAHLPPSGINGFIEQPRDLLLSLICGQSSQWGLLDLRFAESSSSEKAFLSQPPSLVPQLRSVRVKWSLRPPTFDFDNPAATPETVPDGPTTSLQLMKAARLERLSLENFNGHFKDVPVEWSNLTELSYSGDRRPIGFPSSAASALLGCCPNLVRCELHILQYATETVGAIRSSIPAPSSQVQLPHLQRFVLFEFKEGEDDEGETDESPSLALLESLDLPALTSISLSNSLSRLDFEQGPPPLSVSPLLSAQGHGIRHLEFGSIAISVADLVNALTLLTGVTDLMLNTSNIVPSGRLGSQAISHPFYRDGVLTTLANTPICPNLTILKLIVIDPSDITTQAVKNLAQSRTTKASLSGTHVEPLAQIVVRFSRRVVPESTRGGGMPPPFPKRWEEDQLNSGCGRRIIKVERPKFGPISDATRKPFQTFWEYEGICCERC